MKFKHALIELAISASLLTASLPLLADTINNTFDTPFDYVANGIIGDTNWDGIYLRGGDIAGGASIGGSGSGVQNVASTASPFGGFLNLQNTGGDWSGADDDGFFIYKVVQGDFDVSVQSVPGTLSGGTGYDGRANNFSGLQVRAYHTNNSGAPYSTTLTNNAENSLRLWRFNQFNIDGQIRRSTNGANLENTYLADAGTNGSRFYRIVRQNETNITFYYKMNSGDPWLQITNGATPGGVLVRSDWAGVKLQVGIAQAAFSTASRDAIFDDFILTGPNVTFPAMPPAPSGLVTTATNTGGSLTLSWTPAGTGSLVVMSRHPIQHNPVQGITYTASSSYGAPDALLGGADESVVYSGPGNSVTVTNLGANNTIYYVAVYSYAPNSPPVYNTATPATGAFAGPGVIVSAAIAAPTNNIPINGAVKLSLIASFSTGETSDQSASTTWNSSDPSIAGVNAQGAVSGVANGAVTITATFGPFTPSTNITVHSPIFTDTFTATNDFLTNGLIGMRYDGLFLNFGDVPGAAAGADGAGSTVAMDSMITSTNGLYISSVQSTWSSAGDDGPFLYKIAPGNANTVSGDFTAVTHINTMNALNGVFAGLMARTFAASNHSAGPGGTEWHVNYWKQQNGFTSIRRTQAGAGGATVLATGPLAANGWLCLQRVGTNFYFFEKQNPTDLWTLVTNLTMVAASNNAPMEVGIAQQSTAGVNATTVFDSFMLDTAGIITTTPIPPAASNLVMSLNGNLSMTISYIVPTNPVAAGNFFRSVVIMRDGGPVTAQPYTGMGLGGNSVFGDPNNNIGDGNYVVYRSPAPTTTASQSVTVTGLIPGHTYYAAAYTFDSLGTTRTFNQDASTANGHLQDGVLQFLEVLPTPSIPRGGIGFMQVIGHYSGGATLNVSPFATITSDNTNVIKVLNGVLTGITNGTANITLIYSGVTNSTAVTVRNPAFVDGFDSNQDYIASGVSGSGWHGLYNPTEITNPVPGSAYVPLAGSGTTVADANVSSNGLLTLTGSGDGWENGNSGGFFLHRYVAGDFQMAVQVQSFDIANYNQPGLLARAYGVSPSGEIGTPFGTVVPNANGTNDQGEYWVSLTRFDEFGIGTYARRNIDSGVSQNTQPDPSPIAIAGATGPDTNYFLLIVRTGGTEFDFYKRATLTDTWRQVPNKTHYSLAQFVGRPMQVGVMSGPWSNPAGAARTVRFDNFMLDSTTGSPLQITLSGANVILSWPPIAGATLQSSATVVSPNWQNVPGTPALGPNGYSLAVPINFAANRYFRLVQ
jgi:hypothetical protein